MRPGISPCRLGDAPAYIVIDPTIKAQPDDTGTGITPYLPDWVLAENGTPATATVDDIFGPSARSTLSGSLRRHPRHLGHTRSLRKTRTPTGLRMRWPVRPAISGAQTPRRAHCAAGAGGSPMTRSTRPLGIIASRAWGAVERAVSAGPGLVSWSCTYCLGYRLDDGGPPGRCRTDPPRHQPRRWPRREHPRAPGLRGRRSCLRPHRAAPGSFPAGCSPSRR